MLIFIKIVGIPSLSQNFENLLTPTKMGLTRIFLCRCVWVSESFRLLCFLALFPERLRSKITFKILGGRFEPLGFNAPWGFFSKINQHVKECLYANFNPRPDRGGGLVHPLRFFADSATRRRVLGYLMRETLRNFW